MQYNPTRNDWLVSLGLFFAWIITSLGVIIDALYIRSAAQAILQRLSVIGYEAYQKKGGVGIDFQLGYALTTTDMVLLLILGCLALAFIIAIEYYFRKGRTKGLHWLRVRNVVLIEIAVFIIAILILTVA